DGRAVKHAGHCMPKLCWRAIDNLARAREPCRRVPVRAKAGWMCCGSIPRKVATVCWRRSCCSMLPPLQTGITTVFMSAVGLYRLHEKMLLLLGCAETLELTECRQAARTMQLV